MRINLKKRRKERALLLLMLPGALVVASGVFLLEAWRDVLDEFLDFWSNAGKER